MFLCIYRNDLEKTVFSGDTHVLSGKIAADAKVGQEAASASLKVILDDYNSEPASVTDDVVPASTIIRKPMDLGTIQKKLSRESMHQSVTVVSSAQSFLPTWIRCEQLRNLQSSRLRDLRGCQISRVSIRGLMH